MSILNIKLWAKNISTTFRSCFYELLNRAKAKPISTEHFMAQFNANYCQKQLLGNWVNASYHLRMPIDFYPGSLDCPGIALNLVAQKDQLSLDPVLLSGGSTIFRFSDCSVTFEPHKITFRHYNEYVAPSKEGTFATVLLNTICTTAESVIKSVAPNSDVYSPPPDAYLMGEVGVAYLAELAAKSARIQLTSKLPMSSANPEINFLLDDTMLACVRDGRTKIASIKPGKHRLQGIVYLYSMKQYKAKMERFFNIIVWHSPVVTFEIFGGEIFDVEAGAVDIDLDLSAEAKAALESERFYDFKGDRNIYLKLNRLS